MRRFILYFLLSLGCAFAPCLNVASAASNGSEASAPLDEDRYQAYVEKIAKAERDAAGAMKELEYPYIKSFQELADAGAANIELCLRFLTERDRAGKLFVIYSMYELDVDGYDVLVRKLVELYHGGLLSDWELLGGLLPRFSDRVIEQYRNPKIQALLKEIEARNDIPAEIKTTILSIRSGQRFAWKLTGEFDRECARWSEMRSISACVALTTRILKVYAIYWVTW